MTLYRLVRFATVGAALLVMSGTVAAQRRGGASAPVAAPDPTRDAIAIARDEVRDAHLARDSAAIRASEEKLQDLQERADAQRGRAGGAGEGGRRGGGAGGRGRAGGRGSGGISRGIGRTIGVIIGNMGGRGMRGRGIGGRGIGGRGIGGAAGRGIGGRGGAVGRGGRGRGGD